MSKGLRNSLKLTLTSAVLLSASLGHAQIGKPRPVGDGPRVVGTGTGRFAEQQRIVRVFMENVGWGDHTEFEETGLNMKDLLLSLVRKDREAREWLVEVNEYFASSEYKNASRRQKQEDLLNAKVYAKIYIQDVVLSGNNYRVR